MTTSINELPIDPGISSENIKLESREKKPFSDEILEAKRAGLTDLPTRDIPNSSVEHTTDPTVTANYVPPADSVGDYIENYKNEIGYRNEVNKANIHKSTFDIVFDEFRTALLVGLLFFLFQLPIFKATLHKNMDFLFKKDANYNFYGLLFVSFVFGMGYYGIERAIEHFSI